jgi:hypothetical protein
VAWFYRKIKIPQSGGRRLKIKLRPIGAVLSVFSPSLLLSGASGAHAQTEAREDLSACPGSAPEPAQSAAWLVAFCNRTGHDLVIEFHDNECPAWDGSRRGDVYQRTLRRGESKTLPLCYADEPPGKKPAPGTPALRIPGGKGVTTTWNVVGDCGDHSKPLNVDARTFYDRGDYKTGIILLQYPSGAPHCAADSAPAAASSAAEAGASAPSASRAQISPTPAQPTLAQSTTAAASAPTPPPAAASNRSSDAPTLSAVIDSNDIIHRAVQIFAKAGAGYQCNFNLAVTFTDGTTWNDRAKANITGSEQTPIVTRKYLKSVTRAQITSSKCSPAS